MELEQTQAYKDYQAISKAADESEAKFRAINDLLVEICVQNGQFKNLEKEHKDDNTTQGRAKAMLKEMNLLYRNREENFKRLMSMAREL